MSEISQDGADIDIGEVVDDNGFLPDQDAVGDGTDGIVDPPDQPLAVSDFGTTAREEVEGESLDGRLAREVPDATPTSPSPVDEGLTGRLVDTDDGAYEDIDPDMVAYDAGADGGGASAEEAAMHVLPD
ncbi:MAG: DUF5709 domain-containing protein [Actinomycetota bacterium]